LAFILFAYACGHGNFWPIIVMVLGHIAMMSLIHYWQIRHKRVTTDRWKTKLETIYQSVLNGISNLYLWNLILPLPEGEKINKTEKKESFQHQIIVDTIFTLQNVISVILAAFYVKDIPMELLIYVIIGHLL
jgi:hypothetical protein